MGSYRGLVLPGRHVWFKKNRDVKQKQGSWPPLLVDSTCLADIFYIKVIRFLLFDEL